jgi:hypothetical protein
MAQATLSDGQILYAVNDLFIGAQSHVSARYHIAVGKREEDHSSSGIIVSTGLGSSAWLISIVTGAAAIAGVLSPHHTRIPAPAPMRWDSPNLVFSVREPFPSARTSTQLVRGKISAQRPLRLVSAMAGNGVIFSDGIESDFLAFIAGMHAVIQPAPKYGQLVA